MNSRIFITGLLFFSLCASAQTDFKPGFNPAEYFDLLQINRITHAEEVTIGMESGITHKYKLIYRSPELGLMNRWELWQRDDQVAVISFRGTMRSPVSWMANLYAGMIPATGSIHLNDSTDFKYKLASDPRAAVHIGWMIGIGSLAPDIIQFIKKIYAEQNIKNILIVGHSQGGALAMLGTSYLRYARENGEIPKEIEFKSYCSAAPKSGNTYYAYDFDYVTRNGMAYTIVNALDWVPETPVSVQTTRDFNSGSPFKDMSAVLGKQKLVVRWYVGGMFNKMDRSTKKSQRRIEKYLGTKMYKLVKKVLPQYKEPVYVHTSLFTRAGIPIVLQPDDEYLKLYPEDPSKTFQHHMPEPYLMLLKKAYPESSTGNQR